MPYRYDIPSIRGDGIHMGTPMNRFNCGHLPELVHYAHYQLRQAQRMPHATPAQAKAKKEAEAEAQRVLEERMEKLSAYREAFPDLFPDPLQTT